LIVAWGIGVAWAEAPDCEPVADEEVREAAAEVRTELPGTEAHDARIRALLSRLTCGDAAADDPWVQLLLAEAHLHHATAPAAEPSKIHELTPVSLALPVPEPRHPAEPGTSDERDAPNQALPLESGPPAPQDEGRTARIKVRSPVPVRLEGWTGTFRAGVVPTGAYVVTPRFPPDFDPVGVLAIYAAADDVWSVRCTRDGDCEALRLSGSPPAAAPVPAPAPSPVAEPAPEPEAAEPSVELSEAP
jgi:hypothetical protein